MEQQRQAEGCLVGVVRAAALVVVVPLRFVWELLVLAGRAVGAGLAAAGRWGYRWLLRPVGVALVAAGRWVFRWVVTPGLQAVGFLLGLLVVVPLVALQRYVVMMLLVPAGGLLWRWVLRPIGRAVLVALLALRAGAGRLLRSLWRGSVWCAVRLRRGLALTGAGLLWLLERVVVAPLVLFGRYVLVPAGRVLLRVLLLVGTVIDFLVKYLVVVPVGWLWRVVLLPVLRVLGAAVVWAWRQGGRLWRFLVVRPCRWVRREVWWPVKAEARRVAREVRRALLG